MSRQRRKRLVKQDAFPASQEIYTSRFPEFRNKHSLPSLPLNLTEFTCTNCKNITQLPTLPKTLLYLFVFKCAKLIHLGKLPPHLNNLDCEDCENLLFDCLPSKLSSLRINSCPKFQGFSQLPDSIQVLDYSDCPIVSFKKFPSNLVYLTCHNLPISSFPEFPERLDRLDCSFCSELKYIPKFPPKIRIVLLSNCKNITALPEGLDGDLELLDLIQMRISKISINPTARLYLQDCPWLSRNYSWIKRISKLVLIQRSIRKFLFRRRIRVFSALKKSLPKDICKIISG